MEYTIKYVDEQIELEQKIYSCVRINSVIKELICENCTSVNNYFHAKLKQFMSKDRLFLENTEKLSKVLKDSNTNLSLYPSEMAILKEHGFSAQSFLDLNISNSLDIE